jgi:hypothetical protein
MIVILLLGSAELSAETAATPRIVAEVDSG